MSGLRNFLLSMLLYGSLLCFTLVVGAQITDPAEVDALRAIRRNSVDSQNFRGNWGRGDPCMRNWTGVGCSDAHLVDGYLHIQELHLLNMTLPGTIAPEVGNLFRLKILLLNGRNLTGLLPEELGYLPNLDRLQIDRNHISGPMPNSFANLDKTRPDIFNHMNNNSISGQIPPELSRLPSLIHLLLDNNNLSGFLPPSFQGSQDCAFFSLTTTTLRGVKFHLLSAT